MKALLIGRQPAVPLGHTYVTEPPYDGVVIGSLELQELVCFQNRAVLQSLAEGKPVVLYTPGLPVSPQNRALSATLAARQRELKTWGVVFTDGGRKRHLRGRFGSDRHERADAADRQALPALDAARRNRR